MAANPRPYYTPEEYLALERAAEYKSEYLAGEIFAMSGTSVAHNRIAVNLVRQLGNQFAGRPCQVYVSDLRVRVTATGLYTYPDVTVVCGAHQFADDQRDTLLNPTVIFEVLSPSTEAYDRGAKFAHYRRLDSLTDYVLVAQDRAQVEHFARQDSGWLLTAAGALDESLRLDSVDADLPLAAIYENVEFPPAEDHNPAEPRQDRPLGPGSA